MLWRTLLALFALLLLLGAVVVIGSVVDLIPAIRVMAGEYTLVLGLAGKAVALRAVWGGGAFVALLLSALLLTAALRGATGKNFVITSQRFGRFQSSGTVVVSARGMHALASYAAERVKGVYEAATKIDLKRKGWHVDLHIVVAPETSLPDLLADLKERVQTAIHHHTGLPVTRLRVWAQLDPISDKQRRVY